MGRSEWRERYAIATFAKEALTAIEVAGLAASGAPPVIVAHSFGGFPTLYVCAEHPEAIGGAIYSMIYDQIKRGGAENMQEVAPLASYITLAPFIGAEQACTVANSDGRGR